MELMEGIRPAGPPDMSGRFYGKFAELNFIEIARELEIHLWQLMRTMLAITVDVQTKIATSGLKFIIENSMKSFCRKPKPIPVFPKRFNLVTVGKLGGNLLSHFGGGFSADGKGKLETETHFLEHPIFAHPVLLCRSLPLFLVRNL